MALDGRQPLVPDLRGQADVVDKLFGGATETLGPSSSTEVRRIHADGDCVVVEHSGRNEMSDGRRYGNNSCWVLRFQDGLIQEVREYMDTQLVTETFGADVPDSTPRGIGTQRWSRCPELLVGDRCTRPADRLKMICIGTSSWVAAPRFAV